jgi:lytic murein transglycosylase
MRFKYFVIIPLFYASSAQAASGEFNINRWYGILQNVQDRAVAEKISPRTINAVIQRSAFIPDVIERDKNQPEFKTTITDYLNRSVAEPRIGNGKVFGQKYRTLLGEIENKYGVPRNVMLAFWGMESDFGTFRSQYVLSDSFLSLIYEGRREEFFTKQVIALMKIADKCNMEVKKMEGSWAGGMGHFQFIPTTLEQYGVDGNHDGKIDIHDNVRDAMYSAGNFLRKHGWKTQERIASQVSLPVNFDMSVCGGVVKKTLAEWGAMGVVGVPAGDNSVGIVCEESMLPNAYLVYDNFYIIRKWNNSNSYALAVGLLADKLKN